MKSTRRPKRFRNWATSKSSPVALVGPAWKPDKRDVPCCAAKVDQHGRYPIGYCSPECERRPPAA